MSKKACDNSTPLLVLEQNVLDTPLFALQDLRRITPRRLRLSFGGRGRPERTSIELFYRRFTQILASPLLGFFQQT